MKVELNRAEALQIRVALLKKADIDELEGRTAGGMKKLNNAKKLRALSLKFSSTL